MNNSEGQLKLDLDADNNLFKIISKSKTIIQKDSFAQR